MTADAVVIGGGFAGLSAASALAERGRRVVVLEARPTLGGRATAFTDPGTGERVDNGQHVLFGCYHETFRFLRRIGADSHVDVQPRLALDIVDRAGRRSCLMCPRLPSPLHLLAGVLMWDALGWRDRLSVIPVGRALRARLADSKGPPHMHDSSCASNMTVREWLEGQGQTPRVIELLWEPLALAALNQPIDVAAAAPFVRVLGMLFGASSADAGLAVPARPLDELYAQPAREYIEARGGTVRTGAPARVGIAGGPHVLVRGERVAAQHIICAVPWHALPELFVDPSPGLARVLDAARATAASPIVTVNLWYDRAVAGSRLIGLPGRTMQWIFDKRSVFGGGASHLSLVSSGAEAVVALPNRDLIDIAARDVAGALPAARAATLVRAVVVRERRATFSVAPGQPPRPATRTDVSGLLLAGDWIDTGLPATIEGAVLSGHLAADAAE